MQATINGTTISAPDNAVAYKYADPTEDARWVYDEREAREIENEDPNLIVWAAKTADEICEGLESSDPDGSQFADHSAEMIESHVPNGNRVAYDGAAEVQAVAAERDTSGNITAIVTWDGTKDVNPWGIRRADEALDQDDWNHTLEFCGVDE